jgi:transketolase
MQLPVTYVFTHDSIGLGEDGPTHQPIEHLTALRAMPHLTVIRPGDANETAEAWRYAIGSAKGPTALALTRQAIPTFDRSRMASASGLHRGAYVLIESKNPEVILMGTGSELQLCVAAFEKLEQQGVRARVVSMPSWEIFEEQDEAYKQSVLPASIPARVSVEAGSTLAWWKYLGPDGSAIGRDDFGASAPAKDLFKHFGFTPEHVVEAALGVLERTKARV